MLTGNNAARGNTLAGGHFYILNEGVHHDNAASTEPSVVDGGAKTDKTALTNKGRAVNDRLVGQRDAIAQKYRAGSAALP